MIKPLTGGFYKTVLETWELKRALSSVCSHFLFDILNTPFTKVCVKHGRY